MNIKSTVKKLVTRIRVLCGDWFGSVLSWIRWCAREQIYVDSPSLRETRNAVTMMRPEMGEKLRKMSESIDRDSSLPNDQGQTRSAQNTNHE